MGVDKRVGQEVVSKILEQETNHRVNRYTNTFEKSGWINQEKSKEKNFLEIDSYQDRRFVIVQEFEEAEGSYGKCFTKNSKSSGTPSPQSFLQRRFRTLRLLAMASL